MSWPSKERNKESSSATMYIIPPIIIIKMINQSINCDSISLTFSGGMIFDQFNLAASCLILPVLVVDW